MGMGGGPHWVLLAGGAVVSVALLLYGRYATPEQAQLPSLVWWTGVLAGFIGACVLSWKDEWSAATALVVRRPAFAHFYAALEKWQKQDGTLIDNKFGIEFIFKNESGILVDAPTHRVIMLTKFDQDPVSDSGYIAGIPNSSR